MCLLRINSVRILSVVIILFAVSIGIIVAITILIAIGVIVIILFNRLFRLVMWSRRCYVVWN